MPTGAAAEQMGAIERQMQDLLTRMQGVNQSIAAQHTEAASNHGMLLFHKPAKSSTGLKPFQQTAGWPAKLDFSFLHQKVAAHSYADCCSRAVVLGCLWLQRLLSWRLSHRLGIDLFFF